MKHNLVEIVLKTIYSYNQQVNEKIQMDLGMDAPLFGQEGVLDSLELVGLIVELEQAIEDQLGISIVIADERAMSQRSSPFRTTGSLAEYIVKTIQGKH